MHLFSDAILCLERARLAMAIPQPLHTSLKSYPRPPARKTTKLGAIQNAMFDIKNPLGTKLRYQRPAGFFSKAADNFDDPLVGRCDSSSNVIALAATAVIEHCKESTGQVLHMDVISYAFDSSIHPEQCATKGSAHRCSEKSLSARSSLPLPIRV